MNCFNAIVEPDNVLRVCNTCEELGEDIRFVLLAGKLDVSHHIAVADISIRDRITFE